MKNLKYIVTTIIMLVIVLACNDESQFLEEKPKDFFSPENSFVSKTGFESALADIYLQNRNWFSDRDSWSTFDLYGWDLDVAWYQAPAPGVYQDAFFWNTFNADSGFASKWWTRFYRVIFKANTIIGRADDPRVEWTSDEEKNAIVGEAKFLRAYYYTLLANMYGGVPLVLEETSGAKFDYVRATREAVYLQCKEDLTFATQHMPTADEVPGGRAPRAAAYHYLAEVNIQLGNYPEAITTASAVIDGGNFSLMTERFGRYKDFKFRGYDATGPEEDWGDVYWDLFRVGNFNRDQGNREVIWNCQFEFDVEGGFAGGDGGGRFGLARWWGGALYWSAGFQKDKNNVPNKFKDTLMGRPVGYGGATDYLENQVWNFKGDFNRDIRNSKYNIQRTYYWNNPASEYFGTPVTAETIYDPNLMQTGRAITPSFKKAVAVESNPITIQDGKTSDNGRITKDWYIIRLPETYFLRAEAYHLNNQNDLAAADINKVRERAQATPVEPSDVDLDLILDERARELFMEEKRMVTLLRMGKLKEYLTKYNSAVLTNGYVLEDKLNPLCIMN